MKNQESFSFDFKTEDLYTLEGILKLHKIFLIYIKDADFEIYQELIEFYEKSFEKGEDEDSFLIKIAPHLEDFLSYFFNIFQSVHNVQKRHNALSIISTVKRTFVQRFVLPKINDPSFKAYEADLPIKKNLSLEEFDVVFSNAILPYLEDLNANLEALEPFIAYTLWALRSSKGKEKHINSTLFNIPVKMPQKEKVKSHLSQENGIYSFNKEGVPVQDSFSLTDHGMDFKKSLDQANYCIKCHPQKKDSCKRGLKTLDGEMLEGCPIDVKISAFMTLKSKGFLIGALAIILVDNPLVILTGHRICNDCKKACIFQKQDAVDVPAVESEILRSVLELPYGFEIYSLLTKWNPLNFKAPLPLKKTGHTALVVGQGPSGLGIAHELMRSGIQVFAIDGLKIESFPPYLKDVSEPIKRIYPFLQDLDTRVIEGFGGVLEYGITIRWDKNNLFIARLLLERNALYTLKGSVRLGSQMTDDQALNDLKFDHIALCMGAGSPNVLQLNGTTMPKGVRFASDFLMSLQLTGAFKKDSVANLTVDMPIVVIGAGLTAIDTATEAQRYYLRQILKIKQYSDYMAQQNSLGDFKNTLSISEKEQLNRWLGHAAEYEKAKADALENESVFDAKPLLQKWGGATILYRKDFEKSPCFSINPEEVEKAFEEGIFFKENRIPLSFELDDERNVKSVIASHIGQIEKISARSVFIAIGTKPFSADFKPI
ncbi:MAG: FAD-dependent oxidoreductase [Proteobacteria bacterium]|nr:FAD-dependent oxidoreductase [Pseudomonadota bacterium]